MLGLDPDVLIGRAFGIPERDVRLDQHFGQRAAALLNRLDFRGAARLTRRSAQLFDRRAQRRAKERSDTAQRDFLNLVTGVNYRRDLNRLTPAARASLEEAEAAAGEAADAHRTQLPPRERIAVETYLPLLLLHRHKPWPVALTPQQQASIEDTNTQAFEAAATRHSKLTPEQRVEVEALLALGLFTEEQWEQLYGDAHTWQTYGDAVDATVGALTAAALSRDRLPLPAEYREGVEEKLFDFLVGESDGAADPVVVATRVFRKNVLDFWTPPKPQSGQP